MGYTWPTDSTHKVVSRKAWEATQKRRRNLEAVADAARVLAPILETVGTAGEGTGNFYRKFAPAKKALDTALSELDKEE